MATKILRQGDVGLIRLDAPPNFKGKRVVEKRRLIRKGENGGVHELETLDKAVIVADRGELAKELFGRYIEVKEPTRIVHREHGPIDLEPGWYEIRIQRESFDNVVRNTMD